MFESFVWEQLQHLIVGFDREIATFLNFWLVNEIKVNQLDVSEFY